MKHTDSLGENITFYYTNPWGRIVGAFLKWAVRQSHIETKYAEGLAVARKATKKSEEREAYSSDDVGRLLSRGGPRNSDSRVRQKINL